MTDHWDYLNRQSEYAWEKIVGTPLGKLQLAAARLATLDSTRYEGNPELENQRDHLKGKVGQLLREADPQAVLDDLNLWRLTLRLYSAAGLRRLEMRASERKAA